MDDAKLERAFRREFRTMCGREDRMLVAATPLQLWSVLSAVQLACRHPGFNGPTRKIVEEVARRIQNLVASDGALAVIAERGWNPKFDE
jgi:hypothetical protein